MSSRGYYSLIRYVPNPRRDEAINIGVMLVTKSREFADVRLLESIPRASRLAYLLPNERIISAVSTFTRDYLEEYVSEKKVSPADMLDELSHDLANSVRVESPMICEIDDPETKLNDLFRSLVALPAGHRVSRRPVMPRRSLVKKVHEAFRHADLDEYLTRNALVTGEFGRHRIDFIFGEEPFALVQALTVDLSNEMEFVDKTVLWEGKARDICAVLEPSQLAMVWSVGPRGYRERLDRMRGKLTEAGLTLYSEEAVDDMVAAVSETVTSP